MSSLDILLRVFSAFGFISQAAVKLPEEWFYEWNETVEKLSGCCFFCDASHNIPHLRLLENYTLSNGWFFNLRTAQMNGNWQNRLYMPVFRASARY